MRRYLIPVLLLALTAGCANLKIGPHRIDVQQGNALDQENISRLKTGLSRSQVRFLLGTPLVVDPFRNDRWDYVYVFYKGGKLAEQRHVSLFFEGDTLVRIEGDLPPQATAQPVAQADRPAAPPAAETAPKPIDPPVSTLPLAADAAPAPQPMAEASPPATAAQTETVPAPDPASVPASEAPPAAMAVPVAAASEPAGTPESREPASSVVPPLPSPAHAPAYVDPRPPAEPGLQPETDVARIQPDVMPPFPEPGPAAPAGEDTVLKAVYAWASAWAARDEEAYLSAYDMSFVPQGGGSRADWAQRRRLLLGVARHIDVKIDSPSVERLGDDSAIVTFNQFYHSNSYRDAVVKQLRLIERGDRWLIVEEKVLSILRGARP